VAVSNFGALPFPPPTKPDLVVTIEKGNEKTPSGTYLTGRELTDFTFLYYQILLLELKPFDFELTSRSSVFFSEQCCGTVGIISFLVG
jgi:hypothetical protein